MGYVLYPEGQTCALCEMYHAESSTCRVTFPRNNGFPKVEPDSWCGSFNLDYSRFQKSIKDGMKIPGLGQSYRYLHYKEPKKGLFARLFGG